jgi:hypothetical protein
VRKMSSAAHAVEFVDEAVRAWPPSQMLATLLTPYGAFAEPAEASPAGEPCQQDPIPGLCLDASCKDSSRDRRGVGGKSNLRVECKCPAGREPRPHIVSDQS